MAANYITADTFDPERLIAGKLKSLKKNAKFRRLYLKYEYPNGEIDDLIIKTPEMFSVGLFSHEDTSSFAEQKCSYSLGLSSQLETQEDEKKFQMTQKLKDRVYAIARENGIEKIDKEDIVIFKKRRRASGNVH